MGRTSKAVLAVTVALGAPGLGGCTALGYIAVANGFPALEETHGNVVASGDAPPSRPSKVSPALPSPPEAVEVPPEKTDIVSVGEVVISVTPSRLNEAPRPRRFLDGR